MIIDCHGHYTTSPPEQQQYRETLIKHVDDPASAGEFDDSIVSDEAIRTTVENAQLKLQRDRGTDLTIFSPRAAGMGHHIGGPETSAKWARACNNMVRRVVQNFPENFVGVCMLPQSRGVSPANCAEELERCVTELGFIGANVNPDVTGGYWTEPPVTDKYWYPLWEKLVELDVPAMIHVSASCNPNFHTTGGHYIAADNTVFMQLVTGDLFKDFPTLRLIIPHGGGAAPYHWGRYRGMAQDLKKGELEEHLLKNLYFDTCVYHQPGIELLTKVVPTENILFASEMVGAVKGVDPRTGHNYDDTKRYLDATDLTPGQREAIFSGNTLRVFPRLKAHLAS
jgi:4-oxalmesaconate hydratase